MTVSYWQDSSAEHEVECDVCVVGAGIVGSYLARLLVGHGKKVCHLEAKHAAFGASGRNAGMVLTGTAQYYYDAIQLYGHDLAREVWNLSLHNREIAQSLSAELGTPWDPCGSILLALDDT